MLCSYARSREPQEHVRRLCMYMSDCVARYRGRVSGPLLDRFLHFCEFERLSARGT